MKRFLSALGLGLLLSAPCAAQPPLVREVITLQQGAQVMLRVTRPFSSVAIADSEIADALPRSDRAMIIVGKKVGTSDLMIFSDADPIYHATISVSQPQLAGKVFNHNQKGLGDYRAYQCNPVCVRTEDKFEQKEVIVLGGGLAAPTALGGSSNINVIVPPGSTPAR